MANKNVYKFEVIEKIIMARDFETKEEVVELAKKMKDIALSNDKYSKDVKDGFFPSKTQSFELNESEKEKLLK